jgi:hypothetical protein
VFGECAERRSALRSPKNLGAPRRRLQLVTQRRFLPQPKAFNTEVAQKKIFGVLPCPSAPCPSQIEHLKFQIAEPPKPIQNLEFTIYNPVEQVS